MSLARPGKPDQDELRRIAATIKLLVCDVDGVLTDGGLYYGASGELQKRFNVKDGHGLVMARLVGLPAAIITARKSEIVEVRGKELGFRAIFQGRREKGPALEELCKELEVAPAECAYMGDDTNDLWPMSLVGLPACPADAVPEVRARAFFISQNAGGHGAVRELVELLLKASGRWDEALGLMTGPMSRRNPS
ncbi:MAG: KdsC family phosphatase [Myxococcaceae bacterium]